MAGNAAQGVNEVNFEDVRSELGRLQALDGWRGVAVILVCFGHLWPTLLPGGFVGVSVFFALSGYLITSLLVREAATTGGRISLGRFWSRRIRRLAPLALVVLAVSLFATRVWPQAGGGVMEFLAALTHWLNIHYVTEGVAYGQTTADPSAIQHYWSLSIEEQFYIVYPLVVVAALWAARTRAWSFRLILALPLTIAVGLSVGLGQVVAPGTAYYRTDLRIGEIAVGCLAALLFPMRGTLAPSESLDLLNPRPAARRPLLSEQRVVLLADVVGAFGLGVVVGSSLVLTVDESLLYSCGFFIVAIATVSVIWSLQRGRLIAEALAAPPLAWIGRISYGLYLLHWPLIVFAHRAFPDVGDGVRSTCVLLVTVLLAAASYRFIEMPIRRGGLTNQPVFAYGCALSAFAATIFFVPPVIDSFNFAAHITDTASATRPIPDGAVRAVALGDSVLWSAMSSMPSGDDLYLMSALIPGCPFLPDVDGLGTGRGVVPIFASAEVCRTWPKTMSSFTRRDPDMILFSTGYSIATARLASGSGACDAEFAAWYAPRLKATMTSLARVAPVVAVVPHRSFVPEFFKGRGLDNYREMMMCVRRIQTQVFNDVSGVRWIDMDTYLCPDGVEGCEPPELQDGIHFRSTSTAGVQAWLKKIMLEASS